MDDRSGIDIDLEEHEWYQLMMQAHLEDITLNQLIDRILTEFISSQEKV